MPSTTITVQSARGGDLRADLALPLGRDPVALALFAHCFACGADTGPERAIVEALVAAGLGVVSLDLTGRAARTRDGRSAPRGGDGGRVADAPDPGGGFVLGVDDLVSAARSAAAGRSPVRLLVGHSLAGAAALCAAAHLPDVRAVATVNAPADPTRLRALVERADEAPRTDPGLGGDALRIAVAGAELELPASLAAELAPERVLAAAAALRRPLLVLHAPTDNAVGIDHAARILEAARQPKSFVALLQADHLLSGPGEAAYAGALVATWVRPFLASGADPARERRVALARTERDLRTDVRTSGFDVLMDEPLSAGGTDLGPNPYDLLAAALGACTTMTLRLYADRKGWPLEAASARVAHRKVDPSAAAAGEDAPPRRIDAFDVRVWLEGPLDDDQRARLLEIAHRCPVHRTLTSDVQVEVRLSSGPAPTA